MTAKKKRAPKVRSAPPPNWKRRFLAELRKVPSVVRACAAARVSPPTVYRIRGQDSDFKNAWDQAIELGVADLEAAVWERAKAGVSDTLAIFMLKSHRPEVYREKSQLALTNADGTPLPVAPATTVVAPTVVFVQPKKEELCEPAIEVKALPLASQNGKEAHR